MTTKAPAWATKQKAERVELKAARLAALYLLRDELGATPKTHLAEALGISRWTYDRLLASLPEVEINIRIVQDRIKQEIEVTYSPLQTGGASRATHTATCYVDALAERPSASDARLGDTHYVLPDAGFRRRNQQHNLLSTCERG